MQILPPIQSKTAEFRNVSEKVYSVFVSAFANTNAFNTASNRQQDYRSTERRTPEPICDCESECVSGSESGR